MEIIRVDLLFNGKHIISFDDDDSFHDLFVTINDLFTYDDISNLSLKIIASPSEKIKESVDDNNDVSNLNDDNDVPNLGKDFKEVLIDKYNFKPEDIEATVDSVVLFGDPDNWTITLTGEEDYDEYAQFIIEEIKEKKEKIEEYYIEDNPGEYTVWSSSNLMDDHYQIPLVKVKTDDNGDLYAEPVGDSDFDKESLKIATNSLANSKKAGKNVKDALIRLDKTLNHSDPFFSVDLDRNNANSGLELIAAQTLRTLRDDLKAVLTKKGVTEEDVVAKYAELTGVDYYTDEIIDEDQYNQILILLMKDPKDKYNYISPKENEFIQRTKDLTEDLIEKVLLKNDPDFYK